MRDNRFLLIGLILLVTGIILGALGAHALSDKLSTRQLESFKTGVFYQLIHSVLFVAFGLYKRLSQATENFTPPLYIALTGVLLFSVSIYLLSMSSIMSWSVSWLGPVTPVGGLLMIIGWTMLAIKVSMAR